MEIRYFRAEHEKEQGNTAYKRGNYEQAIEFYQSAHSIEPEMPHYQLNLAAAYLKLHDYAAAERACDVALSQHRSVKGYWRRAQARKSLGRFEDAAKDLRNVLKIQPENVEAQAELSILSSLHPGSSNLDVTSAQSASSSTSAMSPNFEPKQRKELPFPRTGADDRKLKITPLPLTLDIPADMSFSVSSNSAKGPRQPPMLLSSNKLTATLTYPSWERYVVSRG